MLNLGERRVHLFLFFFFKASAGEATLLLFLAAPRGLRDLSSLPGIEPRPMAVKAPSLNYWTTREFPRTSEMLRLIIIKHN